MNSYEVTAIIPVFAASPEQAKFFVENDLRQAKVAYVVKDINEI